MSESEAVQSSGSVGLVSLLGLAGKKSPRLGVVLGAETLLHAGLGRPGGSQGSGFLQLQRKIGEH